MGKITLNVLSIISFILLSMCCFNASAQDEMIDIDTSTSPVISDHDNESSTVDVYNQAKKKYDADLEDFAKDKYKTIEEYEKKHKNDPVTKESTAEKQKFYDEQENKFDEFDKSHPLPQLNEQEKQSAQKNRLNEKYGDDNSSGITKNVLDTSESAIETKKMLEGKPSNKSPSNKEIEEYQELLDKGQDEVIKLNKMKKYKEAQDAEDKMYKDSDEWLKNKTGPRPSSKELRDNESDYNKSLRSESEFTEDLKNMNDIDRTPEVSIDDIELTGPDKIDEKFLADIDKKAPLTEKADQIKSNTMPIVKKHQWAPMPKTHKKIYKKKIYKKSAPPSYHYITPAPYRAPPTINCS